MKVEVVGFNPYSFTDEKTGKLKDGVSVFMVFDDMSIEQGKKAGKFSLPLSRQSDLVEIPGIYEADFGPQNKLMSLKSVK